MIPIVLLARLACVGVPLHVMRRRFDFVFSPHAIKIMTWGGLRGGISVALALSLPLGPERQIVLALTYIVVLFSILVQGLTVGRLIKATVAPPAPARVIRKPAGCRRAVGRVEHDETHADARRCTGAGPAGSGAGLQMDRRRRAGSLRRTFHPPRIDPRRPWISSLNPRRTARWITSVRCDGPLGNCANCAR